MISYSICLCLTYFTQYDNLLVHPCCCPCHHFILLWASQGTVVKNLPANAEDTTDVGSIPGSEDPLE